MPYDSHYRWVFKTLRSPSGPMCMIDFGQGRGASATYIQTNQEKRIKYTLVEEFMEMANVSTCLNCKDVSQWFFC